MGYISLFPNKKLKIGKITTTEEMEKNKKVIIAATEEELGKIGMDELNLGGRKAEIIREYTNLHVVRVIGEPFGGAEFVVPKKLLKPCD